MCVYISEFKYSKTNFMFFSHGLVIVTQMDILCIGLSSISSYG
jgi:hypothetical protein